MKTILYLSLINIYVLFSSDNNINRFKMKFPVSEKRILTDNSIRAIPSEQSISNNKFKKKYPITTKVVFLEDESPQEFKGYPNYKKMDANIKVLIDTINAAKEKSISLEFKIIKLENAIQELKNTSAPLQMNKKLTLLEDKIKLLEKKKEPWSKKISDLFCCCFTCCGEDDD